MPDIPPYSLPVNLLGSLYQTQAVELPKLKNPAEWTHERLVRMITEFEKKLDEREEIGAKIVAFGSVELIHIADLGYWGPDMIVFHGTNADGRPVQLIQHLSQLSVLLVSVPAQSEKPRRIGFELGKKLEGNAGN